ncbi:hypothetical protein [Vibrio rotiferianus]|uniref:hypothetical protein n=1 Tax=Vibrio rotiferianus TaxID=190895 RepID=UPI0003A0819B|nr:hypothetical protein [Vibrio rotiferianus]
METHTPTEFGCNTIDSIKHKYFPNFGKSDKPLTTGKDYRFSRRGQAEYKRGHQLVAMRLSGLGVQS